MNTAYSPHKAAHYYNELALFRMGESLKIYPRQVQIDPFNPCNHDCPFCVYRYHRDDDINALFNVKDWIRYEKLVEILDSCVEMGTKGVEATGGGESTLHPQTLEFYDAILERELELGLITNGCSHLWRTKRDEMVARVSKGAWVRFSLDAATAPTHAINHATDETDFWNVIRSISATAKAASGDTLVGVSFVVTKDNYHEIVDAAKLASDLGANNIRFSAAVFEGYVGDYHADHYADVMKHLESAKKVAHKGFTVFTFAPERMRFRESFGEYEEGDRCFYSHLNAVIGADLMLYPCCVLKYRPQGAIVSLKEMTFKEAWESDERRAYYDKLDLHNGCRTCYLKPKNDFIKYLVEPNPVHLNFI